MEEIWKDIEGYEGLYQVSNMGRVKSLARTRNMNLHDHRSVAPVPERILKFGQSLGYQAVTLAKDGVNRTFRVHKLVALAFIQNPDRKPEINHKDGNKHNNKAENLEWVTAKENQRHAISTGLRNDMRRRKVINQYSRDGVLLNVWYGYAEIEKSLGLPRQTICNCCKGRTYTAAGYIWRHPDD